MGDRTGIEWTDASWNPLRGCTRKSKGCLFCFAETIAARFSNPGAPFHGIADRHRPGSKWTGVIERVPHLMDQPLRWRRSRRIFVNSMSDLFHEKVPFEWIDAIFGVMAMAPQHTYQVLTKRPDQMTQWIGRQRDRPAVLECVAAAYVEVAGLADRWPFDARRAIEIGFTSWPPPNVWLGVSVEDQEAADERLPARFVSAEPLLGPVDLTTWLSNGSIDWVIVGGESGTHARPMHVAWVRSLRDQCARAGVPFFFKQWGQWLPASQEDASGCLIHPGPWKAAGGRIHTWPDGSLSFRTGKKRAGHALDGREWQQSPQ